MVLGHYGAALALKSADRKISLALLFFAATLSDIILYILLIAGIEKVTVAPGLTEWISLKTDYNAFSHGLLALSLWGLMLTIIYMVYKKLQKHQEPLPVKAGIILFFAVVSHYFCDLIVHIPDLPVVPGSETRLGLGLWNYPLLSNGLEFLMYGAGWYLFYRRVPREAGAFRKKFVILSVLLGTFHLSTGLVPPMESQAIMGASMLALSLGVVALVWYLEKEIQYSE